MCLIGAASSTRKETALRGCTTLSGVVLASGEASPRGSACAKRYSAKSMDMREQLGKVEEWNHAEEKGNPCSSLLVESYLTFVNEEQKQVGVPVKQAAPRLAHTLAQLLQGMRTRAQLAESLSQRVAITRDIALFSLAFYSMRRGFDLYLGLAGVAITRVGRINF